MKKMMPLILFGMAMSVPMISSAIVTSTHYNCAIQNDQTICKSSSSTDWSLFSTATTYAKTKYPIVLAHGLFGFANIGPVNYWHGIPQDMARQGAQVYTTTVSAGNSDAVRGEQLLKQVLKIKAITGADKVNLLGHSQGVQSIRYVAGVKPEIIASVTGIAGPNKGSPGPDAVKNYIQLPLNTVGLDKVVIAFFNLFTGLETLLSGGGIADQNALAALDGLTTAGALEFNKSFPQAIPTTECGEGSYEVEGVRYYSWSGVGQHTNLLDPSDYVLSVLAIPHNSPNDGAVGACSSHLGKVIRDDYPQNHLDEVNHVLGLVGSKAGSDPVPLYAQHANRLKLAGL